MKRRNKRLDSVRGQQTSPVLLWVAMVSWVEIAPGEKVPARTLVALLDRLDHLIETKLPGTPKDALVFRRPAP